MKTRNVAMYGMLTALAFILSYIESIIPIPVPIPGVKLGLANLVVITALYTMGAKEAFVLSMVRITLVGFTFGSPSTMMFSFAGGLLSWIVMVLFKKWKVFSITGVSILGGIGHNIGQIIVAIIILNTSILIYYLPFLLISGLITGAAIGMTGAFITSKIQKINIREV